MLMTMLMTAEKSRKERKHVLDFSVCSRNSGHREDWMRLNVSCGIRENEFSCVQRCHSTNVKRGGIKTRLGSCGA